MHSPLEPDPSPTRVFKSGRAGLLAAVIGALAACSIGCAPPQSRATLPPLELTTAVPTPVTTPPATATVEAMLADQVGSCVDLVQFGAFTGDPDFAAWWDGVDHDHAALQASCERLATEDPWALSSMADQWSGVRVALDEQQRDGGQ